LAGQPADPLEHLLVAGVGIDDRCQRRDMTGEPLRQEQIPRGPVYVCDGGVAQRVDSVWFPMAPLSPMTSPGMAVVVGGARSARPEDPLLRKSGWHAVAGVVAVGLALVGVGSVVVTDDGRVDQRTAAPAAAGTGLHFGSDRDGSCAD